MLETDVIRSIPLTVLSSSSSGSAILSSVSLGGASRQGTTIWRKGFSKPAGMSSTGMPMAATVPTTTAVTRSTKTVMRRSSEKRESLDSELRGAGVMA